VNISYREEKTPTIRQVWCRLVHSFAEDRQVFVELSIIEGAKGDCPGYVRRVTHDEIADAIG